MGSFEYIKTKRWRGKVESPLNKLLDSVEWGEFKIEDLFDSTNGNFDIQKNHINDLGNYVITSGLTDNGILGKTDISAKIFDKNTITIDMFGNTFFRSFQYKMVTHARVFSVKSKVEITENQGLFLANSFHFLNKKFGYDNMCSWVKIKSEQVQLPTKNNKIDFDFMETFIIELEREQMSQLDVYLKASGLKDYDLTDEEEKVLHDFENINWGDFTFKSIFNKIAQGRRLTKNDQLLGNIPFVMAGRGDTGISNYISNPVASFPRNSITIDILGNTFYRDYAFGAGDDTGVYWNDSINYSRKKMLFISTSMEKSLLGQFDFGKKLRSSQSSNFQMKLPIKDNQPDYQLMEIFISAIQKQVIKDVVLYTDKKLNVTNWHIFVKIKL